MRIPGLRETTLLELTRRVWSEINQDRCFGRAAELGFFFMMALFPFLMFLIGFLSFLPGASDFLVTQLVRFAPPEVINLIRDWLDTVCSNRSGGLLSFTILLTLWTASTGTAALVDLLNIAYDVGEGRSYWKTRWLAAWLTVALTLLVVGGTLLITFGGRLLKSLLTYAGLPGPSAIIGAAFSYAIGFAMVLVGIGITYYFGPNVRQKWRWVVAGALFAVIAIALVSYLFTFYLTLVPSFDTTYGGLGAVMVMMLWLYLISFVILVGGEINSELHHIAGLPKIEKEKSPPN